MFDSGDNRSGRSNDKDQTHYVYPDGQYGWQPIGSPQPPRRNARLIGLVAAFLAVAVLFSALTGVLVYQVFRSDSLMSQFDLWPQPSQTVPQATQPESGSPADNGPVRNGEGQNKHFSIEDAAAPDDPDKDALSIMEIAAKGGPAVVAITTETLISTPFGQSGIVPAAGSGFILSKDGYIVTNHHVIAGARKIQIVLATGETHDAVLVGSDSLNDLAVLKINGNDLPTVVLGRSSNLQVGELAVAIGNALGELQGTVTAGIISALNREIKIDGQTMILLQTDAAINSGNSGGALFNSFGEVIGINTAKNAGAGIEGLGFAIPIDHAKPIIESLIQNGSVVGRPRIGIYTQDVDQAMADQYNLPIGVYVAQIEPGSPAEDSGLREGDVIVAANGQEALTTDAINQIKNKLEPGDAITLTVVRDGRTIDLEVILGEDIA
jgi:serine protease Do